MIPFSFSKTRLAPTPSGYLHAGNAANFLLTAGLAKQAGASLLLRIDDLDRERLRPAYVQDVFDTLRYLNIEWAEGPKDAGDFEANWSQRHRMPLYEKALQTLRAKNVLYACACTRTQLAQGTVCRCREKDLNLDEQGLGWRLTTDDETITVHNFNGKTERALLPASMQNFVVRRKDGVPAYQLASVVDDVHFGVDFIVRGQDLWPSTLAQLYLASQLGEDRFLQTRFLHHPLLTDEGGAKLSKSEGAAAIKHWREEGKSRKELLAEIGHRLGAPEPIVTPDELAERWLEKEAAWPFLDD